MFFFTFTVMKKMTKYLGIALISILLLDACKNKQLVQSEMLNLDTLTGIPEVPPVYRASRQRTADVIHTKLNLSFNWDSAFVNGEAELKITPHFYELKSIELDAKGFEILEVGSGKGKQVTLNNYGYEDHKLTIHLPKPIQRNDTVTVYIKYIAKPNKLELGGSSAIAGDKGLYFINPDGSDPDKPRQIWTQGETEANSCWFPTVDSPNEKFTTDIYLTIDEDFTSVSNGLKMFSVSNGNGTKTEYWKMSQPHAAYLVMLAIGPFAEYNDHWGEMDINYYLDSAYLPYAHDIFGTTPEMLSYFSDYLGVKYPWPKYDQVVVRDYVSGAMENTTATIHGEFVQQTRREMIDYNHQDIIAHELFHHWFGDLVTCESWSNLTLNEGFATYGEVLWAEHKLGQDEADLQADQDLRTYLNEAHYNQVDLIRFYYDDKEDMFDSHSYSKGARVLHMLRNYVGEEAFRASLKLYLERNAYQTVEVHDLRLAFEEITGEDLNWFFNQWFLASGHPIIEASWEYNDFDRKLKIYTSQDQNTEKAPLYYLPVSVEFHLGNQMVQQTIEIGKVKDTFEFNLLWPPDYLNFDPGNVLLGEVNFKQEAKQWKAQYANSKRYIDRKEALQNLFDTVSYDQIEVFKHALNDEFWAIRDFALAYFEHYLLENKDVEVFELIKTLAESDINTQVRSNAIYVLSNWGVDDRLMALNEMGLLDSSYAVVTSSFEAICETDSVLGKKHAKKLEREDQQEIVLAIAELYADFGNPDDHDFFRNKSEGISGYGQYSFVQAYGQYISQQSNDVLMDALPYFRKVSLEGSAWWIRLSGMLVVMTNHSQAHTEHNAIKKAIGNMKSENPNYSMQKELLEQSEKVYKALDEVWNEITANETYPRLVAMIEDYNSRLTEPDSAD